MWLVDEKTKVVNLRKEKSDFYIGRGSIYGNPFTHIKDKKRKQVVSFLREKNLLACSRSMRERMKK